MTARKKGGATEPLPDWGRKAGGCCLVYVVLSAVCVLISSVSDAVHTDDPAWAVARGLLLAALLVAVVYYAWWAYDQHQQEQARKNAARKLDEYHLCKRAQAVAANLPSEVLESFERRRFPWEQVARSVLQSPGDIDYVCDTDYEQIDHYEFEEWTATLFSAFGYSTSVTKKSGDAGIDVFLRAGGDECGVVQCKQNAESNRVGLGKTKQFLWVAKEYQVGYIVTTSDFTKQAREEASGTNVTLVNGADLATWVADVRQIRAGVRAQSDPQAASLGGK